MVSEARNMDCMDYMRRFQDGFFDLAVVDPPYGLGKKPTTRVKKYGQLQTANELKPTKEYFEELFRVSKHQIIWGYNHLSDMLPKCTGFIFWYKHQPVATYAAGELAWTNITMTAKCFDYPYYGVHNQDKHRIHPTQKPVALYKWLFENFMGEGRRVLDTHLGSGSSRIAAYALGLDFYGCEIDPVYYKKQENRFRLETEGIIDIGEETIQQMQLF